MGCRIRAEVFVVRMNGAHEERPESQEMIRDAVPGFRDLCRGAAVPVSAIDAREAITRAHHEEWARVVATLTRRFGDLDIAEEAAAEAFATAVQRWPADGVPPNPGAWLTTTAGRKAIDRIRRENKRDDKHKEALLVYDDDPPERAGAIADDRLRLIFTCCHPALAMESRLALTLRMVGGLTVPEIARAFLVAETAMGQRITRAKAKIKAARIPYRVPAAEDLPGRVSGVLAVLYLVFNEGYLATGPGTDPVRHDLTAEAIRLTRLIRALMPDDGEVAGLLALMLLTEARRTARVSAGGELVALDEQDRGAWDAALIAEGHRLVRERLAAAAAGVAPCRYQILAAINAVHTSARDIRDTDWSQVLALYDQLIRLDPSPIIALNRAVAVAELDGPQVALAAVDRLEDELAGYHAYHATRADLLRRLGRGHESRAAYDKAIELAGNTAETAYLKRRRGQLGQ
ncbi:RNA polymerase ECF family sigma subunit [Actinoallomurus bryophytorum]|uniref:RNA polymerase ECF family sigma subunit n=1 Tax=Actinoallomurus bryophytorum TaxID=1490222 RepID=A0A543CP40_9ACTN|nr:RNA polymerase ECF family sigma subunit [Actinoallomurus bryophytorum]